MCRINCWNQVVKHHHFGGASVNLFYRITCKCEMIIYMNVRQYYK